MDGYYMYIFLSCGCGPGQKLHLFFQPMVVKILPTTALNADFTRFLTNFTVTLNELCKHITPKQVPMYLGFMITLSD